MCARLPAVLRHPRLAGKKGGPSCQLGRIPFSFNCLWSPRLLHLPMATTLSPFAPSSFVTTTDSRQPALGCLLGRKRSPLDSTGTDSWPWDTLCHGGLIYSPLQSRARRWWEWEMRGQGIFSLKEIYLYPLKQLKKFPFNAPVKPLASFSVTGRFLGRLS